MYPHSLSAAVMFGTTASNLGPNYGLYLSAYGVGGVVLPMLMADYSGTKTYAGNLHSRILRYRRPDRDCDRALADDKTSVTSGSLREEQVGLDSPLGAALGPNLGQSHKYSYVCSSANRQSDLRS